MNKTFKMRRKPSKPIQDLNKTLRYYIYQGDSLKKVLDQLTADNVDIENTEFEYYEESCELIATRSESKEEYQRRLDKYEDELVDYNEWYTTNKEKVDAIIAQRKESSLNKEKRALEAEKARLSKLIDSISAKEAKIKKTLK